MIRSCRTRRRPFSRGVCSAEESSCTPRPRTNVGRADRPTSPWPSSAWSTVAICIAFAEVAVAFEDELAELLSSLPGLFDPLWRIAFWAPLVYAVALLLIAALRDRRALARDILGSIVLAVIVTAVIAALVMDDDRGVIELLLDIDGPPVFPPLALVVATAAISTSSPHLSRPFRHLGRWLIGSQVIAVLLVQAAVPSGAIAAFAVGTLAAAARSPRLRLAGRPADRVADQAGPRRARRLRRRPRPGGDAVGRRRAVRGERSARAVARQGVRPRRVGCPAADVAVADGLVPGW